MHGPLNVKYFQLFCKRAGFLSIILVAVQYSNKILRITFQSMKICLSGFKTTNVEAF